MRGKRGSQRDLFETQPTSELRADVGIRLAPLLQALLTEAISQEPRTEGKELSNASPREDGDDQDHV